MAVPGLAVGGRLARVMPRMGATDPRVPGGTAPRRTVRQPNWEIERGGDTSLAPRQGDHSQHVAYIVVSQQR